MKRNPFNYFKHFVTNENKIVREKNSKTFFFCNINPPSVSTRKEKKFLRINMLLKFLSVNSLTNYAILFDC